MCLHICRPVYLFLTIFSEPYTEIMGDSPGSTLYIDIRLESFLNYLCWVEYSWEVRLYHFHMRNLFWYEVCNSLKHMDNVSFQCWISKIEIVECAFQHGFKMCEIYNFEVAKNMCKIYNFEVANKTKCVKYIILRLQIKFPRSVLNLTCIVHSPEVPAAIFWKHNGQVFFRLSYHIFTFSIICYI